MTAWQDESKGETKYAEARKAYKAAWKEVLFDDPNVANSHMRDHVHQAIADGRVVYHLRLGPDTKISDGLKKELETVQVPGSKYDWDRYTYDYVLKIGSGA